MIRVAVIGCGKIAQVRHLPEYATNPNAQLVAYYDKNSQRAHEVAAQYGGKVYDSYFDLLKDPEIDAVSVCVENRSHAEMTTAALYAGKHVLCEKPMAVTLAECESMVAAAEFNNRHLMIGHNMRFDPVHRRAKELLELVGLPDKAQAYPAQLSGGQQQRVAIARALATQPKVLLCDEATSALDPNTTHQILELIRDINQKLGITVVVITHQMSVVKTICNHVAILDGGEVAEKGLVSEVFAAPKSAAGRRLVFPGGADALVSDPQAVRRVRLTFRDSVTTGTPLVARLASEEGILCTVISASTQKLSEEVYGSMLLGIPSGQFQRAMDYISTMSNIRVEEVDGHVQ